MSVPEVVKQFGGSIGAIEIVCVAGLVLFGVWLLRTSFGRGALVNSIPRRNDMPLYLPFVPLLIWFGFASVAMSIIEKTMTDPASWQKALLDNIALCAAAVLGMSVIIFLVRVHFAQRLKGFGLNVKTIHKDFFAAVVNLLSVWPFVVMAIMLTIFFGKLFWGQEFEMQQHQELELITAHPQLLVRVLIIITAVVVVPVFEEMLFRGLFQTVIRSFVLKPWLSVIISSALFTVVHQSPAHWPALFTLAICMGYSYEKSGSLFRPIFIHSIFNATNIVAALNQ